MVIDRLNELKQTLTAGATGVYQTTRRLCVAVSARISDRISVHMPVAMPPSARRFVVFATVLLLPMVMAGSIKMLQNVLANQAEASVVMNLSAQEMSNGELLRTARTIKNKVLKDPSAIVRLSREHILILLDEPDLSRVEGTINHLQYTSDICVMDVFVAADAVNHYEIRPRKVARLGVAFDDDVDAVPDARECLTSLSERRFGRGFSLARL